LEKIKTISGVMRMRAGESETQSLGRPKNKIIKT
jgi:hypothetical protein